MTKVLALARPLAEAAAATKDPELMDATRAIQAKHGALVPFEGLRCRRARSRAS